MVNRVLVVEDDRSVREAVELLLERSGFEVASVADGEDIDPSTVGEGADLVLLDIMLPSRNGFDVCRAIRATSSIPIVMLTARADTADVVKGLELGADDYVTKPFEPAELIARVRSALRRSIESQPPQWTVRDVAIDEEAFRASKGGEDLGLTATEFRLLVTLARRSGQVLSREVLLERVWGYDYLGDSRLVDMAVLRLRSKLGEPTEPPPYITTVRSVGYRFDDG